MSRVYLSEVVDIQSPMKVALIHNVVYSGQHLFIHGKVAEINAIHILMENTETDCGWFLHLETDWLHAHGLADGPG